ncbi:TlpA family protein disulfide reductase [Carboxylicivirga marina]|uniref:TlpA family protein disulfide reductase n=1 Tax=Carboxylicivirga marina TaxID=2800988 RepID=A0ABS1HED1_9BACT|nr:TlpA disulfide reductase family protein [Carboxylicivirga marina]MBK3515850.1 TlpA family protein disulfide reductase [Carboxylicivirga marina]
MKQLLLAGIACLLLLTSSHSSFKKPTYSASTASYVELSRITLSEHSTVLDFVVNHAPERSILLDSTICIQNSETGKKYPVTKATDIILGVKQTTGKKGILKYSLHFPAIDPNTKTIHYIGNNWKLFDIQLNNEQQKPLIPEKLLGNWLKQDGSYEWVYGLFEKRTIYKNAVWENKTLKKQSGYYLLNIENDNESKTLYLKPKGKQLLIGESADSWQLHIQSRLNTPKNDSEEGAYQFSGIKNDTAIYKGYIHGFHPMMGQRAMLYLTNIFLSKSEYYSVVIQKDGSFSIKVPIMHAQEAVLRLNNSTYRVLLEPGKESFQFIDYTKDTDVYGGRTTPLEQKTLFMGETAKVNNDIVKMDSISYKGYQAKKMSLDANPEEYKAYCLEELANKLNAIEQLNRAYPLSKQAIAFKQTKLKYQVYAQLLDYNQSRTDAYKSKHNIPRQQKQIDLEAIPLKQSYFDFIRAKELNNPEALLTPGSYGLFLSKLSRLDDVLPKANFIYKALKDSLINRNSEVSGEELELLKTLSNAKSKDEAVQTINSKMKVWVGFYRKHVDLINKVVHDSYDAQFSNNLKTYLKLEDGLAKDILFSQLNAVRLTKNKSLPNTVVEEHLKTIVVDQTIEQILLDFYQVKATEAATLRKIKADKTAARIVETPKVKGGVLLDGIMQKYKGQLVYVDFWATWCAPCMNGIKKIAPLKEELNGQNIAFVYITNESSPKKNWLSSIQTIKGDHYRLNKTEWNHLKSQFAIKGIPRYMLVNNDGQLVDDNVGHLSNKELKKLFKKHGDSTKLVNIE